MKVIPRAKNPFVVSVYENYSNGITAAELAEKCGYECFRTFQRHFKKHFGDTT
jgi:AraC-like DNA-binding protein